MTVPRVLAALREGSDPAPEDLRAAVRESVRAFAAAHPGRSVELRVPPYVAVQCVEGPRHTRGTPPNVVETDGLTWLRLVAGLETWEVAVRAGRLRPSGERSNLADLVAQTGQGG